MALLTLETQVFIVYKQEDKVCVKYLQNYAAAIIVIKIWQLSTGEKPKYVSPESKRGAGLSS